MSTTGFPLVDTTIAGVLVPVGTDGQVLKMNGTTPEFQTVSVSGAVLPTGSAYQVVSLNSDGTALEANPTQFILSKSTAGSLTLSGSQVGVAGSVYQGSVTATDSSGVLFSNGGGQTHTLTGTSASGILCSEIAGNTSGTGYTITFGGPASGLLGHIEADPNKSNMVLDASGGTGSNWYIGTYSTNGGPDATFSGGHNSCYFFSNIGSGFGGITKDISGSNSGVCFSNRSADISSDYSAGFCNDGPINISGKASLIAASQGTSTISGADSFILGSRSTSINTISNDGSAIICSEGTCTITHSNSVIIGCNAQVSNADNEVYMDNLEVNGVAVTSDATTKKGLRDATTEEKADMCPKFCSIKSKRYRYKNEADISKERFGFDADELEAIYPGVVNSDFVRKYKCERVDGEWKCDSWPVDELGEIVQGDVVQDPTTDDVNQGVIYRKMKRNKKSIDMMALLTVTVEMCQEQQKIIHDLQTRITALEG